MRSASLLTDGLQAPAVPVQGRITAGTSNGGPSTVRDAARGSAVGTAHIADMGSVVVVLPALVCDFGQQGLGAGDVVLGPV